ncbi:hypothetical protein CcaverHIS002_0208540 [Cutaneotrichosporon cavernicola]|nr:hypothetical protein CcaverHIS002_0208540 [Cutaneotrichosporon cavernicola]BEI97266.1 hypothetical protein CcaverHIS631_0208550 [Cutaneotrichosporon cavernicola]
MSDLTTEERIKLAVSFIEQSPPGEVNDVVNAIRTIIGDDDALMPHAVPALRAYNLAQLQVVNHPASEGVDAHSSLLSDATLVPNTSPERFYDHVAARTFMFDHVTLLPGDYQPITLPEADEAFRAALADSLGNYARNHFPSGHASVSTDQIPLPVIQPESEQTGRKEEESTPLVARTPLPEDEVDAEGGMQALEEEVEAVSRADEMEEMEDEEVESERDIPGRVEDNPTPEDGPHVPRTQDEVDAEGGMEALDEEIDEVSAEQAKRDEKETEKEMEKETETETEQALTADDAEDAREADEASPAAESSPVPPAPVYTPLENPTFTLEIVGNRFNPSNFWTGRWRTRWVVDRAAKSVAGTIRVDVHYYEQGNVQLTTEHRASFVLPEGEDAVLASAIVSSIARIETEYQLELGVVYSGLGDKAFRALRRALPVTRQRVDWDKVSGYSIGSDLSKAFA